MKFGPRPPSFIERAIARFWAAVLFICFFPVFVVLAVKLVAALAPFVFGAAVVVTVVGLVRFGIGRRREEW